MIDEAKELELFNTWLIESDYYIHYDYSGPGEMAWLAAKRAAALMREGTAPDTDYIDILFDGPPSHKSGRFVEVENSKRQSIHAGEWIHRDDGFWVLRIVKPKPIAIPAAPDVSEAELAEIESICKENILLQPKGSTKSKDMLRLITTLRAARKREGEAVELLRDGLNITGDAAVWTKRVLTFLAARETAALNEGANNG